MTFFMNKMMIIIIILLSFLLTAFHTSIFKNTTLVYCHAILKNPSYDSRSPTEQTGASPRQGYETAFCRRLHTPSNPRIELRIFGAQGQRPQYQGIFHHWSIPNLHDCVCMTEYLHFGKSDVRWWPSILAYVTYT